MATSENTHGQGQGQAWLWSGPAEYLGVSQGKCLGIMASALSRSTFLSADNSEPSPPPPTPTPVGKERGLSWGEQPGLALCLLQESLAPVLAGASLSWTRRPLWPAAAPCPAGCCLAAGGDMSCWCCQGVLTRNELPGRAALRKGS